MGRPFDRHPELSPDRILWMYSKGYFPMTFQQTGRRIHWLCPDPRTILPLDRFHVSHNLGKLVRKGRFEVALDQDVEGVIRACADRDSTWITEDLITAYVRLAELGFAHSVECRYEGQPAGGLYGVAIKGAFFGESMYHTLRDASKVALVHLVEHMKKKNFRLLDTQFNTAHLQQFGAIEIRRSQYLRLLRDALEVDTTW